MIIIDNYYKYVMMEIIKWHLKQVAMALSFLVLLQGCTAYKSSSTLENAAKENTKTLVKTKVGEWLKFKSVEVYDEKYYGLKKVKGEIVRIQLDEKYIDYVRVKNKTTSIVGSGILGIIGAFVLMIVGYLTLQ